MEWYNSREGRQAKEILLKECLKRGIRANWYRLRYLALRNRTLKYIAGSKKNKDSW